jgi:predicted permease
MNLRDWTLRIRALLMRRRVERELDEELAFHIERETQELIDRGMAPDEARWKARATFGSAALAADQCRDERGTAGVENTLRDVGYALRTFRRAPLASLTIVMTVAIGLGLVAVLFTVLNMMLFRVDNVPDVNEMFSVERPRSGDGERRRFTRPQYEAMRRESQAFAGVYAELPDIETRIDGRVMSGSMVTGNFFQVLGVHAAQGRALLPEDDEPSAPHPVMVLSDRSWTNEFGSDPTVVGRRLTVNGAPHEIIGVMPRGFRGLEVTAPDYWAPLSMLAEHRPLHRGRENTIGVGIVGRLRPGVSAASARAQLEAWDSGQTAAADADRRTASIELRPKRGTVPEPIEAVIAFTPLFFAFGLILLIGCANVANLLLARGVSRQKEIGVRLSLGASRPRIIRQLLTESLLLSLVASGLGFLIARGALAAGIAAIMRSLPVDIGDITLSIPSPDWRVGVFLVVSAVIATALFGLMPALQATRIDPVRTMRGEIVKDARPHRSRSVLIGLQVAASALLLICSAVFLRSAFASATVDPGFRTADTVLIDIVNEPKRQAMVQAVTTDPSVTAVAATWPDMNSRPRAAFVESAGAKAKVAYMFASPEYFSVLDIPVLRGRAFSAAEGSGRLPVAIVADSLAKTLWPRGDAVGQVLQIDPDQNSPTRRADEPTMVARSFTVVGVTRDVAGIRIADTKWAEVYLPAHAQMAETALVARVHGDPDQVRRTLLDRLTLVDPNMGQVMTMRTMARMEWYLLRIAFWTTLILGGLALTLTVSGLFSVLSYLVEQRAKEIGVRIALGATSNGVTRLVIAQTSRPVILGLLAGTSLAVALATLLLSMPGAGAIGEVVHVLDPIAYAGSLLFIIVACLLAATVPASRASRLDPMQTLRQE